MGGQIPFMHFAVYTWWYAPTAATSTAVDNRMELFLTPWDHFLILSMTFSIILDFPINFNECHMALELLYWFFLSITFFFTKKSF